MKRILVTGSSGSGKSTVARDLGQILDLPVTHLDLLHWRPGWQEATQEEFDRDLAAVLSSDAWIIDGNYGASMSDRLARADTVFFLDLPRRVCLWRVLRRPGKPRPDLPADCPERRFSRDYVDFLKYVWHWHTYRRPELLAMIDGVRASRTVYHLRDQASIDRMLTGLRTRPR